MGDAIQFWNNGGEAFAKVASDPNSFFARRTALVAEFVSSHISPGRMLDIGCGTGQLCFELATHRFDVYGTDLSALQIQMAIQNARGLLDVPNQRFRLCTPYSLPFEEHFDLITAIGVMPYVEDHFGFLQRSLSLLKPTGMFVASSTNRLSLFTFMAATRHLWSFRPNRAWFAVLANLIQTGLRSGTCVDPRTARQCGSAGALDRLCEDSGLTIVGALDLYNVLWGLLDRSPSQRRRVGRMLSRHLGWNHIGAYRRRKS